ncbi:MAG: hypothetical protein EXS59_01525 [Candidatus Taylorbacteria bacterium]|nr:hypothetical protein [Candidatus Taylorbacteria bacterium]
MSTHPLTIVNHGIYTVRVVKNGKIIEEFPPTGEFLFVRTGDSLADATEMLGEIPIRRDKNWHTDGNLPPLKPGTYHIIGSKAQSSSYLGRPDVLWFEEHTWVKANPDGGEPPNTDIICVEKLHGFMPEVQIAN